MKTTPEGFCEDAYEADVERDGRVVHVSVPRGCSAGTRIDKYLTRFYPEASRSKIQRSIRKGHLKVNGSDVQKSYRVESGDEIIFRLVRKPPMQADPEPIPLDVVYEDDLLLVVNKTAGMVVHPSPGHGSGTLVHALLHHVNGESVAADDASSEADDEEIGLSMVNALPDAPDHPVVRPGIVHRLDKGTSGLLVVAKRDRAHQPLAKQFQAHSVDRQYRGIVWGDFNPPSGKIEGAIGRDPNHRQRMAVVSPDHGKWAVTHYSTEERHAHTSVVRFELETGRTHQIRVHARDHNSPLFGDEKYGGQSVRYGGRKGKHRDLCNRLFDILPHPALHAQRLGFRHPGTGDRMQFDVDPPEPWKRVQNQLERYSQES